MIESQLIWTAVRLGRLTWKFRSTRSGAGRLSWPLRVVRVLRLRLTPSMPATFISRATRFLPTR